MDEPYWWCHTNGREERQEEMREFRLVIGQDDGLEKYVMRFLFVVSCLDER